ncbi:MAG: hypothetical protein Q4F95_11525 [Oscillospiraceae bacterium]|nr:hypothetical protein [Oscillospiraceae bacterium]
MKHLKPNVMTLRTKLLKEYNDLRNKLDEKLTENKIKSDIILDNSEYFFIVNRIYICFLDFAEYINGFDDRIINFMLTCSDASDILANLYMNGLDEDCDIKSVEGIEKLMIYAYNNEQLENGNLDFVPVECNL